MKALKAHELHERRCRWRADLCRYSAAVARADAEKVSPLTATALRDQAEASEAEAELHDLEAEVSAGVADVKARRVAGEWGLGGDFRRADYEAVVDVHLARRRYWREVRAALGQDFRAVTVDNFVEPTDAELEKMGG